MRVVLGSDHTLIRAGLSAVVERAPSAEVVAVVSDWQALLAAAEATVPDLVLLDVEHSGFGWVRAAERIHRIRPQMILACISSNGDMDFLREMQSAGVITRSATDGATEETLTFIRELTGNGNEQTRSGSAGCPHAAPSLTPRENDILLRVARGFQSHEIARELGLSVRTIEFHRANILRKTGARSVADLTRYAIQSGGLPLEGR